MSYLDAVDDVLLLGVRPMEVVRADDVDCGGGGAPLHHVHYVVCVGNVEPANTNTDTNTLSGPCWNLKIQIQKQIHGSRGGTTIKTKARHIILPKYRIYLTNKAFSYTK